jgi:aminoglycoside phosphotransferase (APT) family kinase protein
MPWCDAPGRHRLTRYLAAATGARAVVVEALTRLHDGAVHENWQLVALFDGGTLAGYRRLVLRTDAATKLTWSHDRIGEFAILRTVHAAGVTVPAPLLQCADAAVIGKPFFLMSWMPGAAAGQRVVAGELGGERETLAIRLAEELARLHAVRPPRDALDFLPPPPVDPAQSRLAQLRRALDADHEPHPVAEWGLRWLTRQAPPPRAPVLCHGDFRTGNYLADARGFTALLDWEFAGWSDPCEDISWFCLGSWRFGAYGREAGGIVPREFFYRAYEAASGERIDAARVRYWEVMAAARWLVIALQQRDRFLRGGERSLDLALTGRRPAECEFEILKLTAAA